MTESKRVKAPAVVAVVAGADDLRRAQRLSKSPDFFELRLDALWQDLDAVEKAIPQLLAPLILTARHPAEGGAHNLNTAARRALLLRFLDHGTFVDLELRSLGQLRGMLRTIGRAKLGLIISSHHLRGTPSLRQLQRQLQGARENGADIFKIAARTDTRAQLDRLIAFFETNRGALPIAAMGMGKLGDESRRRLAHLCSALLYTSLGAPIVEGQLPFSLLA